MLRKRWVQIGLAVLALVLIVLIGGAVWFIQPVGELLPQAEAAMQSGDAVTVSTESDYIVFRPVDDASTTGFIFYPGARVVPEAYAPPLRAIAEAGYLAVVVPMPLNLAVFDAGAASGVVETFSEIEHWVIGGHSLGGAMAARYAGNNLDMIDGLVLWAAYPEGSNDLSGEDLVIASIYGTRDGLASQDEIDDSRDNLPPTTNFVAIEGGNHANFGYYGDQPNDQSATIPREAQQQQVISATVAVLDAINE